MPALLAYTLMKLGQARANHRLSAPISARIGSVLGRVMIMTRLDDVLMTAKGGRFISVAMKMIFRRRV